MVNLWSPLYNLFTSNICDRSKKHVVDWWKTIIWHIYNIDLPQERKIYIFEELWVSPVEAGGAVGAFLLGFEHLQQRSSICWSSSWCHFNVVQETDFPRPLSLSRRGLHMVDKVKALNGHLTTLALALSLLRAVQSHPAWPGMRFHPQNWPPLADWLHRIKLTVIFQRQPCLFIQRWGEKPRHCVLQLSRSPCLVPSTQRSGALVRCLNWGVVLLCVVTINYKIMRSNFF